MGAAQLLNQLRGAGFELAADDGQLVVMPASRLDDAARASIRQHKADLLVLLSSPPEPTEGHRSAANDDPAPEAPPHPLRRVWLVRMAMLGMDEGRALALADRLERRDVEDDDRRACVECSHLGNGGRCLAAAVGRLRNTDKRHEPVLDLLQRCEGFGLRKGMQ